MAASERKASIQSHRDTCRFMAAALCIGLMTTLTVNRLMAEEAPQSSASTDDWSFNISPYVWAASLDGGVAP